MSNMTFRVQSFQEAGRNALKRVIARSPPSRLLNLHALRRSEPTDPAYVSHPFFLHPILNRSILVKHNMRYGEESLDGRRRLNTLKLIFPLDVSNLSLGSQSLLPSQCDLFSVFPRIFESDYSSADRDIRLIGLLDEAPTLDPFLLQEIVAQYGFDVAPCYFSANRHVLRQQTEVVAAEIKPVLELFGTAGSLAGALSARTPATAPNVTPQQKIIQYTMSEETQAGQVLSECFFNWKVVLYYRWRLTALTSASKRLLVSLAGLRSNDGQAQTTRLTELSRRRVLDAVSNALFEASTIVEDYDLLHYAVLRSARADLFRALLCESKTYFMALGARISRLEDALGFWSAHAPGGPERVDTYTLESFMASFDRHIGSDLPLPDFNKVAPSLGLIDQRNPPPVTSRFKSGLRD